MLCRSGCSGCLPSAGVKVPYTWLSLTVCPSCLIPVGLVSTGMGDIIHLYIYMCRPTSKLNKQTNEWTKKTALKSMKMIQICSFYVNLKKSPRLKSTSVSNTNTSHLKAAAVAMHMTNTNGHGNGLLHEQNLMCHKPGNILFALFISYVFFFFFFSNRSSVAQEP